MAAAVFALVLCLGAGLGSTAFAGSHGHHHARHHHHHHHGYRPQAYLPPNGHIFHGVTENTKGVKDVRHFANQVGAHPAVVEDFYQWDTPLETGALQRWHQEHARGVLSLSTAPGGGPEVITPHQIAQGKGDHYLVRDNQSIANSKQVVYIRLFPEMNGYWNPYGAFNADGSARPGHSTKQFVAAWRRIVTIVRGGSVKTINAKLQKLGLPRMLRAKSDTAGVYARNHIHGKLAHPKVAFIWNPQTISNPPQTANSPSHYWPGRSYVDWVGADIYSKFATAGVKSALQQFQNHYRHFPFALGEYGPWDNDTRGKFVHWLFRWAERNDRVRMLNYYRSTVPDSPFDVSNYPGARHQLSKLLDSHKFLQYAPELRPGKHHHRHG